MVINMIEFTTLSKQEEKCIKNARKQVQSYKKWGRLSAVFYLFISITMILISIVFIFVVMNLVRSIMGIANPANPNQQQINAADLGLALGLTFGFSLGILIFKGMHLLFKSINLFKGNITSHLLIKYHDGILNLLHNLNEGKIEMLNGKLPPKPK